MANGTATIDNPLSLNALPEPEDGGPLPRRLAAKVGSMTQPLKFAGIVSDPYPPLLFLELIFWPKYMCYYSSIAWVGVVTMGWVWCVQTGRLGTGRR